MKKIITLGGFLGSGKTTFLMRFARYLTELGDGNQVVIIENEIGEVGIDDKLINNSGMTVKNLFAGCVCCSIAGELEYTLKTIIAEFNPDYIIVEATGLAYTENVKKSIQEKLGLECLSICLVDSLRWFRLVKAMPQILSLQLNGADFILVNKIDLVDLKMQDDVVSSVQGYHPETTIYKINATQDITPVLKQIIT